MRVVEVYGKFLKLLERSASSKWKESSENFMTIFVCMYVSTYNANAVLPNGINIHETPAVI